MQVELKDIMEILNTVENMHNAMKETAIDYGEIERCGYHMIKACTIAEIKADIIKLVNDKYSGEING